MSFSIEPTNIGLSENGHQKLKRLEQEGYFALMADAYRFAIALALAQGALPDDLSGPRVNVFGVATIDPERDLYTAIGTIVDTADTPVYRWAERLADWGVHELVRRADEGALDVGALLLEAKELSGE